ncbi:hypothetical protein QE152_g25461 [Popillia japonica]|uniref:Uncharacterized protein n=1 Tax=Popillia japonica TaxID=7064 RepID=A0AAW1K1J1_POPJA
MVNNPGKIITDRNIGHIFGEAYLKAATLEIAINGFQRTAGRTETDDADWNSSGDEPLINLQIPPTNTKIITDGDGPTNATPGPSCVGNDTMHFRSPWQIRALPKYDQPTSNTRKKQKCSILTSTPVKEQLEQKEEEHDQPTSNTRKKQKCSILTSTLVKEQLEQKEEEHGNQLQTQERSKSVVF